jgi:cell wall-associated NlpC family hydrolase
MHSTPLGASLLTPRTRLLTLVLIATLMATGFLASAPSATAATASRGTASAAATPQSSQRHATTARKRFSQKAERVLRVTRYHKGDPYRYGGAGPHSFDCSGLVMFVFRRALGRSLPHYAQSQWQESHHITRSEARPGDLVFQLRGNYAFHVGIYAGNGYMWDAPHSGARVHRHLMYSGRWGYGRLIRS